ncbi:Calx-beta domain-containing protein, partial [Actinoplanes sp. NPDC089786]|uniref:Calx-beta domain-containing protein n=1 Tax=Actinoplanes sp. NPDC089786 TaxID=3155185 RepID=UPI0034481504
MLLATAVAAFIGLVPAVFVATPAYAAGEVDFTSDQESVENDAFVFELVRQGGSPDKLDLTYTTEDGTAEAGKDYTAISGTTSFPAGSTRATTKKFTVQGLADALDEDDETFTLKFTGTVGGQPIVREAQGILDDDDVTPTYTLAMTDTVTHAVIGSVNENVPAARITATLSAVSGRAVTIPLSTSDGTAVQPDDYTGQTNTPLSIPTGQTTGYVDVPINDDLFDEEDMETFSVAGSGETNTTAAPGPALQVQIADNDAMPTVNVLGPGAETEGTQIDFTVNLSAASKRVVTVVANTETGTASSADFTAVTNQSVVFSPGETIKTVSVPTTTDALDELTPEDFKVKLTAPGAPTQGYYTAGTMEATGHITDDDALPVVSMSPASVTEGNVGVRDETFTVSLGAASGREVRVGYAVQGDSATEDEDFEAVTPGELVFAAGQTTKTFTVKIKSDVKDEPNEDFKVILSNAAGTASLAPGAMHTVTINDDDALPQLSTFPDLTMAEGDTQETKNIQVALTNPSSSSITLDVTATPGSAVIMAGSPGANDFEAPSSTVTIPAGQTTANVTFQVNGDEVYEGPESATIKVATTLNDPAVAAGDLTSTLTLNNDDDAPLVELQAQTGRTESQTAAITATVTGVSQDPVAITLAAAGDAPPNGDPAEPGDFDATNLLAAVNLPAGVISNPWTVGTVDLIPDTADENAETVKVSLTGVPDVAPVWLTINDDAADKTPTIVAAGLQKNESDGTVQVPVTLSFSLNGNQALTTEKRITAGYTTEDGTAKQPGDYTTATGTVDFVAGDVSESIPVTINEDTVFERTELFKVKLATPSPGDAPIAPASVDVEIADNDSGQEPVLDDLVAPAAFAEGTAGTADFTVKLDRVAAEDVDVKVTVTDGSATHGVSGPGKDDFELPASPVTVHAGDTSLVVPITINNDDVFEHTETATVGIELAPGETDAVNAPQPVSATLTIVDDDPEPTVVLNTVDGAEGSTVPVTGTMTGVTQDPIAITVVAAGAVNAGSHQADPQDFTAT